MATRKKNPTASSWAEQIAAVAKDRGLLDVPKPAAPAPQTYAPDPSVPVPDAAYIGQTGANNQRFDTTLAGIPGQLQQGATDYGYTFNYDPSGGVNGVGNATIGGVDTSNPYSRAALLQRSYDQQRAGNTTSMAARGQLYSGALQNEQNQAAFGFGQQSNANQRGFQDLISRVLGGGTAAKDERDVGNAAAYGDLIGRLSQQPAGPNTYSGVPYEQNAEGFLNPLKAPTAGSVLQSGSLKGTSWDKLIVGALPKKRKKP